LFPLEGEENTIWADSFSFLLRFLETSSQTKKKKKQNLGFVLLLVVV
jgi:hypothetical protein